MTILLLKPYAAYAQGASVDLDNATEASLVAQGLATYTVNPGPSYFPLTATEQQNLRELATAPTIAALQSMVSGAGTGDRSLIPLVGYSSPFIGDVLSVGDFSVAGGTPTLSVETGPNGKQALKITIPNAQNAEVNIPAALTALFYGEATVAFDWGTARTAGASLTLYVGTAGYAGFATFTTTPYTAPLNNPEDPAGAGGSLTFRMRPEAWTNSAAWVGTPPTYPIIPGACKLRITTTGAAVFWLYAASFSDRPKKSRIAVIWDDGYDSAFLRGIPIFQRLGIPQTLSLIGSIPNTGGALAYWRQLRQFVDDGNALVAHGPWPNGGAGNVFTAYPGSANPTASAVADMVQNREALRSAGLLVTGAEKCYVWPQGAWQQVTGDKALLDAALAAGFEIGRAATPVTNKGFIFNRLGKYQRLCMPIIGHTWAGTTAAEATNIAAVVASINAAATAKEDLCLMLHRAELDSTADGAMTSISARISDLTTMANAIAANVAAGTQEAITMPAFNNTTASWWVGI